MDSPDLPLASSKPVPIRSDRFHLWLAAVVCLAAGGLFGLLSFQLGNTFEARWRQLREGMSESEVQDLLEAPDQRIRPFPLGMILYDMGGPVADSLRYERWVYEKPGAQADRSYTLYFDRNRKLVRAEPWFIDELDIGYSPDPLP